MKNFIFLYPISQIINFEIENNSFGCEAKTKDKFFETLNRCIDERYRKNGYIIYFAVFNDTTIDKNIFVSKKDFIIEVGISYVQHVEEKLYPDQNLILKKIGGSDELIISGFHARDCVDRLAKTAYLSGINTLVDDDLTDFLFIKMKNKRFSTEKFPGLTIDDLNPFVKKSIILYQKERPWLYQY